MVDAPRSAATRLIDTAASPSDPAIFTAASTIRSRLSPRLGPLVGRCRTPQACSMLAGSPVPSSSINRPSPPVRVDRHPSTAYNVRIKAYGIHRKRGVHMTGELAVEVAGLAKSYGSLQVLAGVDIQVPRGTVFSLLGPNGAGKTTM